MLSVRTVENEDIMGARPFRCEYTELNAVKLNRADCH
jgi:hypothetical protein